MVTVSGDNLIVGGETTGAEISISVSQSRFGTFTLTGNGNLINGSRAPVTFSGISGNLNFSFEWADLALTFDESNPIIVGGNLAIVGGLGSNTISTQAGSPGSLSVGGNVSILNLAGGTESISLQNLNVKGNVQIQNVSGNAVVAMDAASAASLRILNGPGQFDQTDLSSIHVTGTVQINNLAEPGARKR